MLSTIENTPMLFIATDMKKFKNSNVFHLIYRNKGDIECPFLNIRILTYKPDFAS
jgi:hypothetical protein